MKLRSKWEAFDIWTVTVLSALSILAFGTIAVLHTDPVVPTWMAWMFSPLFAGMGAVTTYTGVKHVRGDDW